MTDNDVPLKARPTGGRTQEAAGRGEGVKGAGGAVKAVQEQSNPGTVGANADGLHRNHLQWHNDPNEPEKRGNDSKFLTEKSNGED